MTTPKIFWQAHRGGGAYEAPDNTMVANHYTWGLGGIPEADVRTTKDDVIVCFHDATPARTTTVDESLKDDNISTFSLADVKEWDAGVKFAEKFRGTKVPTLEEVFQQMQGKPERLMYLDLKEVDLVQLGDLIDRYQVNEQIIFTHHQQANCIQMKKIAEGVMTMMWIMGDNDRIKQKYEEARASSFDGLDQIQIHLKIAKSEQEQSWPFELEADYVRKVIDETSKANVDFEVFLYSCDAAHVHLLLDEGIRWFATDEPSEFLKSIHSWREG